MVQQSGRDGHPVTNGHSNGNGNIKFGEIAMREAWGASQIGPFDYVPPLGFREYWYPALWVKEVSEKKPKHVKLLGEDIVFFRGKTGEVEALSDWCPHRNARLSLGICEFPGTITCPYHGYTFDGTGQCVAERRSGSRTGRSRSPRASISMRATCTACSSA
jgi:nitrite reductase/ring-hydroxylating ferredoxin subunit